MKFKEIPIELLVRQDNVRSERDSEITDLEQSIGGYDLLQPVLVAPIDGGKYGIICGHRRVEAMKRRGEPTIPCIIRDDLGEKDRLYVQLVENVNRKQMSAQELVDTFDKMKKAEPRLTDREIAKRIGKPESFVYMQYQAVRLLDKMYGEGEISKKDVKSKTVGQALNEYRKRHQQDVFKAAGMYVVYSGRTLKISFKDASSLIEFLDDIKLKYKLRRTSEVK